MKLLATLKKIGVHVNRISVVKLKATHSPSGLFKRGQAALLAKGTIVSFFTLSRCLSNEFGQKSPKPAHRPCLTTAVRFKHFDFPQKYEDLTAEQWVRFYSLIIR